MAVSVFALFGNPAAKANGPFLSRSAKNGRFANVG